MKRIRISDYRIIRFLIVIFIHLSFVICHSSFALDVPTFYGQELVVTAARLPHFTDKLDQVPANVTVITREDISESLATDLPELLNQYEGLIVADSLGYGLEANVGMRGFGGEGKNVLVLLDGVRLSEPFDNTLFWKLIPLQRIERVEIVRGGVSSIYGGGALAGAINIITQTTTNEPKLDGHIVVGDYGQRDYAVSMAGPFRDWQYLVDLGQEQFNGYRENSEYLGTAAKVKIAREISSDRRFDFTADIHQSNNGIAGGITEDAYALNPQLNDPDSAATDGYTNKMELYSVNYDFGSYNLNLFTETRKQDSVLTYSSGTSDATLATHANGATLQWSKEDRFGLSENALAVGAEYRKDEVDNPSNFVSAFGPWPTHKAVSKNIWGFFVQDNLSLVDKLNINLGLRYDKEEIALSDILDPTNDKNRIVDNLSPKLGLVFRPDRAWSFFANLSQSFKAPESNTLIFETPGLFTANPDIEPTVAGNFETGLRYRDDEGVERKVAFYRIESMREIIYNDSAMQNQNFDTLRRGIEASLRQPLLETMALSLSYTYGQAVFTAGDYAGKRIPMVPQNKWTANFDKRWPHDFKTRLSWLAVNTQYALNDFNNAYPVDGYEVFDFRLARERENINLYFDIKNVFAAKYSAFNTSNAAGTIKYNPAPGRRYVFGLGFTR
ncbi:MAG: TonB-dependent receptor [bacterium]